MANMSYCRFTNTLRDLRDCLQALEDMGFDLSDLSDEENAAAQRLIQVCDAIAAKSDFVTGEI